MAEIAVPFALSSGKIAQTNDPYAQAQQHVTALVSTTPGERVMLPSYGVSTAALVFASDNEAVAAQIAKDTQNAIGQWEPTLVVTDVTPADTGPAEGVAAVNVDFRLGSVPGSSPAAPTVTVLPGGDVISG